MNGGQLYGESPLADICQQVQHPDVSVQCQGRYSRSWQRMGGAPFLQGVPQNVAAL